MRRKHRSGWLQNFIEGKGFYILLLLCLVVIGLSSFYLVSSFSKMKGIQEEEPIPVVNSVEVTESLEAAASSTEKPTETVLPEDTASPETAEDAAEEVESAAEVQAEVVTFAVWPVQGEVTAAFSPSALQRDVTMGDWRTHMGVDLAAEMGTNVQAAADGIVTEIRDDFLLGRVMTVDHGGGLVSIYGNLAEETLVSTGDHVTAGCVLGQVGQTAAGEAGQVSHLHFGAEQDGETIDPTSLYS